MLLAGGAIAMRLLLVLAFLAALVVGGVDMRPLYDATEHTATQAMLEVEGRESQGGVSRVYAGTCEDRPVTVSVQKIVSCGKMSKDATLAQAGCIRATIVGSTTKGKSWAVEADGPATSGTTKEGFTYALAARSGVLATVSAWSSSAPRSAKLSIGSTKTTLTLPNKPACPLTQSLDQANEDQFRRMLAASQLVQANVDPFRQGQLWSGTIQCPDFEQPTTPVDDETKCESACHKDLCRSTYSNSIPRGAVGQKSWLRKKQKSTSGCCAGWQGACDLCCPPKPNISPNSIDLEISAVDATSVTFDLVERVDGQQNEVLKVGMIGQWDKDKAVHKFSAEATEPDTGGMLPVLSVTVSRKGPKTFVISGHASASKCQKGTVELMLKTDSDSGAVALVTPTPAKFQWESIGKKQSCPRTSRRARPEARTLHQCFAVCSSDPSCVAVTFYDAELAKADEHLKCQTSNDCNRDNLHISTNPNALIYLKKAQAETQQEVTTTVPDVVDTETRNFFEVDQKWAAKVGEKQVELNIEHATHVAGKPTAIVAQLTLNDETFVLGGWRTGLTIALKSRFPLRQGSTKSAATEMPSFSGDFDGTGTTITGSITQPGMPSHDGVIFTKSAPTLDTDASASNPAAAASTQLARPHQIRFKKGQEFVGTYQCGGAQGTTLLSVEVKSVVASTGGTPDIATLRCFFETKSAKSGHFDVTTQAPFGGPQMVLLPLDNQGRPSKTPKTASLPKGYIAFGVKGTLVLTKQNTLEFAGNVVSYLGGELKQCTVFHARLKLPVKSVAPPSGQDQVLAEIKRLGEEEKVEQGEKVIQPSKVVDKSPTLPTKVPGGSTGGSTGPPTLPPKVPGAAAPGNPGKPPGTVIIKIPEPQTPEDDEGPGVAPAAAPKSVEKGVEMQADESHVVAPLPVFRTGYRFSGIASVDRFTDQTLTMEVINIDVSEGTLTFAVSMGAEGGESTVVLMRGQWLPSKKSLRLRTYRDSSRQMSVKQKCAAGNCDEEQLEVAFTAFNFNAKDPSSLSGTVYRVTRLEAHRDKRAARCRNSRDNKDMITLGKKMPCGTFKVSLAGQNDVHLSVPPQPQAADGYNVIDPPVNQRTCSGFKPNKGSGACPCIGGPPTSLTSAESQAGNCRAETNNNAVVKGGNKNAWRAPSLALGSWTQMDLLTVHKIAGVAVAGDSSARESVSSFTVLTSTDGAQWSQVGGPGKEFTGVTELWLKEQKALGKQGASESRQLFFEQVSARFVRIIPQAWNKWPSLKVALLESPTASTQGCAPHEDPADHVSYEGDDEEPSPVGNDSPSPGSERPSPRTLHTKASGFCTGIDAFVGTWSESQYGSCFSMSATNGSDSIRFTFRSSIGHGVLTVSSDGRTAKGSWVMEGHSGELKLTLRDDCLSFAGTIEVDGNQQAFLGLKSRSAGCAEGLVSAALPTALVKADNQASLFGVWHESQSSSCLVFGYDDSGAVHATFQGGSRQLRGWIVNDGLKFVGTWSDTTGAETVQGGQVSLSLEGCCALSGFMEVDGKSIAWGATRSTSCAAVGHFSVAGTWHESQFGQCMTLVVEKSQLSGSFEGSDLVVSGTSFTQAAHGEFKVHNEKFKKSSFSLSTTKNGTFDGKVYLDGQQSRWSGTRVPSCKQAENFASMPASSLEGQYSIFGFDTGVTVTPEQGLCLVITSKPVGTQQEGSQKGSNVARFEASIQGTGVNYKLAIRKTQSGSGNEDYRYMDGRWTHSMASQELSDSGKASGVFHGKLTADGQSLNGQMNGDQGEIHMWQGVRRRCALSDDVE